MPGVAKPDISAGDAITVVYSSPSVVGGTSPIATACTPASGSTFPLGSTTVSWTATDAQQRASTCTLTVTVTAPPRIRRTKVVAFGDSITLGQDGQDSLTVRSPGPLTFLKSVYLSGREYPTVLLAALQARYTLQAGALVMTNQGLSAEPAGDPTTLTRFTSAISGTQVVLILEGSNDLYNGFRDSLTVEAGLTCLQRMVRAAKAAGVVALLATVPPMNPTGCTPACRGFSAALVPAFNDRIRLLAATENVTLVDVYKEFNGDLTLISPDGLHPNAAGYERIASAFFQSIKGTLEQPATVGAVAPQPTTPVAE